MVSVAVAAPASPVRYRVSGQAGAVSAITIAPAAGGRLVADHMLAGAEAAEHERTAFAAPGGSKPGGCAYATSVRPFTRLRRFGADGRLQWEWNLARERSAPALLVGETGECLSPGGTRLLVSVYTSVQGSDQATDLALSDRLVGQGVIAVGPGMRGFVKAGTKQRGLEAFGNPRTTGVIGWHPGKSATLEYEVDANMIGSRRVQADFSVAPGR